MDSDEFTTSISTTMAPPWSVKQPDIPSSSSAKIMNAILDSSTSISSYLTTTSPSSLSSSSSIFSTPSSVTLFSSTNDIYPPITTLPFAISSTPTTSNTSSHSPIELDDNQIDVILTGILYGTAFITGIVGNGLIIYIVAHFHRMRTLSNVFLASLAIADLLLVIVSIPPKFIQLITYTWDLGNILCKLLHYVQNLSAFCSVMTLTTMSIERYYAIIHPVKCRTTFSMRHIQKIICLIWLLAAVLAVPALYVYVHIRVGHDLPGNHYWCVKVNRQWAISPLEAEHWAQIRLVYESYQIVMILFVPALIMTYTYSRICVRLWTVVHRRTAMRYGNACHIITTTTTTITTATITPGSSNKSPVAKVGNAKLETPTSAIQIGPTCLQPTTALAVVAPPAATRPIPLSSTQSAPPTTTPRRSSTLSGASHTSHNHSKQQQTTEEDNQTVKQVIKMLVAVVVVYLICWTPVLVIFMLRALGTITETNEGFLKTLVPTAFLLQYLNSVINPFIYGFMSKNFRLYFKQTLFQFGHWIFVVFRLRHLSATSSSNNGDSRRQSAAHYHHHNRYHQQYNAHQCGPQFQQVILMQQQRRQSAEAANANLALGMRAATVVVGNGQIKKTSPIVHDGVKRNSGPSMVYHHSNTSSVPAGNGLDVCPKNDLDHHINRIQNIGELVEPRNQDQEDPAAANDSDGEYEMDSECRLKSISSLKNNSHTVSSVSSSSGSSNSRQISRMTTNGSTGTTTSGGGGGESADAAPDDDTESGW